MNLSPSTIQAMKAVGLGVAGAGVLTGAGLIGHRVGASRMSTAMVNAFAEQNAIENEAIQNQMADQFAQANKVENTQIAKFFFNRGLANSGIQKTSSHDVLYKLAGMI
jgi:hypothetical protein